MSQNQNNLLFGFIKKNRLIEEEILSLFDLKESFSILLELKNNNNK